MNTNKEFPEGMKSYPSEVDQLKALLKEANDKLKHFETGTFLQVAAVVQKHRDDLLKQVEAKDAKIVELQKIIVDIQSSQRD